MTDTLIIAEAGVNHNGDLGRAVEMVFVAAEMGADVVKFQAFNADALTSSAAATAPYQKKNTGIADQISLLESLALDLSSFEKIAAACDSAGIEFLATPFDHRLVDHLIAMGMKRIKVASGELTNAPALCEFSRKGLPILLSTGMATLSEIEKAIVVLGLGGPREEAGDLTLLQCTSLYPAPADQMNLRTIPALKATFGLPVGLSDHSLGVTAALGAVAIGASVVEKHFTLDRHLPGPDHAASLEPVEFGAMVSAIREMTVMLGSAEKQPSDLERETARHVRRSWHTARSVSAGMTLGQDDLILVRPADGLPPDQPPIGRKLRVSLDVGVPVTAASLDA